MNWLENHALWGRPIPGDGPPDADILILGEMPGPSELRAGQPFAGSSGFELEKQLAEAGIALSSCYRLNVIPWSMNLDLDSLTSPLKDSPNATWTRQGSRWIAPEVRIGYERLAATITLVKPKVIIALGNLALFATTGRWGVGDWRGSTLEYNLDPAITVVPAYAIGTIFRNWAWRIFNIWDFKRAARVQAEGLIRPDYQFIVRPTFNQLEHYLNNLTCMLEVGPVKISCDIETRAGHTACIGLALNKTEAICIPLMARGYPEYSYWTQDQELAITRWLKFLLTHPNARVIGQNFSYDAQYFWRHMKFVPRLGFDTLLGSHVLFPGLEKGLDVLSSLYCEYHVYWKDDGKEWSSKMDETILWQYNCMDCVRTFEIAEALSHLIKVAGLEDQCLFLHEVWHLALSAMIDGVRVDTANRDTFHNELQEAAAKRLEWMKTVLGFEVNPKSPKQMIDLFYNVFQQRVILGQATRKPTCDDKALTKIQEREPLLRPLVQKIQEFRSISVFKSTFVDAPLDIDQRMRTQYKVAGTETFRLSSSENAFGSGLNMQNIPKGEEDQELNLPNVRKLFIPDPDHEIADGDLKSADLYVVVWEADEPDFKALLRDPSKDAYTEIAKEYFNDPSITKRDPRRQRFKSLAHGTNYLGKPAGMAQKLGLQVHDVARVQSWYYSRFPGIDRFQKRVVLDLNTKHTIHNIWGFRRVYFDRIEGTLANQAVAWIGQSTVAIYINKIWAAIAASEAAHDLAIRISLQVHDSLVFQYPIRHAVQAREAIASIAASVEIPYKDPLVIPFSLKWSQESWGNCE